MADQSAREMLGTLRMANGGSVSSANQSVLDFINNNPDASVEAIATKINSSGADLGSIADSLGISRDIADQAYAEAMATNNALLAAEERILGEIAADPASWNAANAYNEILKSGVSVQDALDAGVKQSTIDAVFTSGAPLSDTSYYTPSTVTSAFESPIYSGQSMEQIRTGAQKYVAGLMADGVIDENERREIQTIATEQGVTFQDMLAAGVDPSILFDVLPTKKKDDETKIVDVFPQIPQIPQIPYTPPTVYQPIDFDPSVFAPGEESLDRAFRDSPPRTEVLDQYGNLVGFDYTPAAKLLSATGSGFSWTPPTVTGRPRSLLSTDTLGRYTQGRAAQDLRQLVGGNEQAYQAFAPLLSQTGSYGGGLSRSQLFALMQQQANQQGQQEASNYAQFGTRFGARPAGTTGYSEIAANVPMYAEDMRGVNVSTGSLNDPMTVTPVDFRYGRSFAEGGEVKKPEGSEELTAEGDTESAGMLANLLRGAKGIPSTVYEYGKDVFQSQSPSAKVLTDIFGIGGAIQEGAGEDPIGYALDIAPGTGEIRSAMDAKKYSDLADEARAAGDTEAAKMYEQLVTFSMAGAAPLAGLPARAAKRTVKAGAEAATQSSKMLDDLTRTTAQAPKIKEIRESSEDVFGPGTSRIKYIDEETGGVIEIVERPEGQAASVIEILVPEESRRQGVAKRLQQHALERHPYLFSQTSSKYAAKNAYDLGHRPYGDPNLTLEDAYRLIDENSSVNMVAMPDMPTVAAKAPEAPTVYPSEKLRADPVVANDPIAVRFNEQIAADPQAAIEQYKLLPKTKGGKILNADLVRELSPDYLKDRSLAKNVHEPASELNKVMYQQRLADDMGKEGVWVFTGGGAASGKSAGLSDAAEDAADLVMDGTLANFDKSVGLIDAAADSGKAVQIVYIDRDPQKAIVQMLDRAIEEGRPVPLDVFLDGHRDARQSIKKLTEKYADDPRVDIQIWDNQGGKGDQFLKTIDNLSEMDYDTALKESLKVVDEYYAANKIDQKLYDAITGDLKPRTGSASEAVPSSRGAGDTQSGSRNFINDFRRNSLSSGISTEARRVSGGVDAGDIGGASGPYTRETVQADGADGLLTFSPDEGALRQYQENGYSLPLIRQVDATSGAVAYNADMTRAMENNPMGPQVEIKSPEELAQARLFRTESGSGFAIKPDGDVVAVFASANEAPRGSYAMLQAAVQAGGKKLDAFDTYLPKIYEKVGFKPVARLPWNDEFAPPNWDKKVFEEYNAGEPDIVFFVHDPEYFGGAKDVPVVTDYDDAVRLQDEALTAKGGDQRQKVESITDAQRDEWRKANKGDFRQTQTPELAEAARDLQAGKISVRDYSQRVKELRPIEPITEVPKISSFEEIAYALDKNKVEKGLIGLNKEIPDGTLVGSRLDIPAYNNYDTWVVSVHEGTGVSGKSMGYGKVAVLDDVKFNSNPDAALGVATGKKDKAPFARMNGKWRNMDAEEAKGLAEKYLNDPEWTQVGMNPYRHSFFYDKATGNPVASADQVIQIGPLVLAKNTKTRPLESPEHMLKKSGSENPQYFKKGGNVERITNDNRTYL